MDKTVLGGVLSFVAEGIIVFNERGEITQLNPHASLLLDYTTDELSGKHVDSALSVHFDETPLALEETVFQTVFVSKKICGRHFRIFNLRIAFHNTPFVRTQFQQH